jgi:LEA14-like dessication related protein
MTGRKILGLLTILLCLFLIGAIWWGTRGKKFFRNEISSFAPEIKITSIYISNIDEHNVTIVGESIIKNRFPAPLVADSLDYDLYIDSVPVLHSGHFKEISIPRGGSETVKIPMHLDVQKIRSAIRKFENEKRDSALYTIKGDFKMKIPVAGFRKFNINESRMAPAIRDIHVKAGKMNFGKMGLKNAEMSMPVDVENHNAFPIKMKDGKYSIEIDHGIEMHGDMDKIVNIPAKGSETIDVHINAKTLKLPKLGYKWLFKEHRTHYHMKFSCTVLSDAEMMRHSTLKIKDEGTLDELKQLTKKLKD